MTPPDYAGGPLDVATLTVIARRADSHSLITSWAFQPDALSPRRLELRLDDEQYPASVEAARLDVRWFEDGDYTMHYLEFQDDDGWQCRWDRHPKPDAPAAHFHPLPDAPPDVAQSEIEAIHHLGVLFAVLDWVETRIATLHEE